MLEILKEERIKPKKSLSQNFLVNENAAKRIVESLNLQKNETVLEIGPGKGALTRYLIEKSRRIIGVEIDKGLCDFLKKRFSFSENLRIINQDFLKIDFEKAVSPDARVKVIGNLPYQITSPALALLLENKRRIKLAVLMVQKEVAQRICAQPDTRNWSPLSIGIQLYSDPKILFKLKPSSFKPSPKVESAVIRLEFLIKPKARIKDESFFFRLVKAAFAQRRKMILNSVSASLDLRKDFVLEALKRAKIDPKKRAEALTLEKLASFSNILNLLLQSKYETN